jgi:hypothetical protein
LSVTPGVLTKGLVGDLRQASPHRADWLGFLIGDDQDERTVLR